MKTFSSQTSGHSKALPILPRIARADRTAIRECVDFYGNLIWALAKETTGSAAEAEKAVPEIFADIWKNAGFYDWKFHEEAVWVAVIARRNLNKYRLERDFQATASYPKEISAVDSRKTQVLH